MEIIISMKTLEFTFSIVGIETVFHAWKSAFFNGISGSPRLKMEFQKTHYGLYCKWILVNTYLFTSKNHKISLLGFLHTVELMISIQIPHKKIRGHFEKFPVVMNLFN